MHYNKKTLEYRLRRFFIVFILNSHAQEKKFEKLRAAEEFPLTCE